MSDGEIGVFGLVAGNCCPWSVYIKLELGRGDGRITLTFIVFKYVVSSRELLDVALNYKFSAKILDLLVC